MGSSSGPTETTSRQPPEWLQQAGRGLLQAGTNIANQPYQPYDGPLVAELPGMQQGALGGINSLMYGTGSMGNAEQMLGATLRGEGGNQFTEQVADRVSRGVTDQYNNATQTTTRRFNSPGGWGSQRHLMSEDRNQENLSRGLGDALGSVYSTGYENERNRQMQAVPASAGLYQTGMSGLNQGLNAGNVYRGYQQELINAQRGIFNEQRDYPWQQIQRLGSLMSQAQGGAGSTSTTQGPAPDRASQYGGLALAGLNAYNGSGGKGGSGYSSAAGNAFANPGVSQYAGTL